MENKERLRLVVGAYPDTSQCQVYLTVLLHTLKALFPLYLIAVVNTLYSFESGHRCLSLGIKKISNTRLVTKWDRVSLWDLLGISQQLWWQRQGGNSEMAFSLTATWQPAPSAFHFWEWIRQGLFRQQAYSQHTGGVLMQHSSPCVLNDKNIRKILWGFMLVTTLS